MDVGLEELDLEVLVEVGFGGGDDALHGVVVLRLFL